MLQKAINIQRWMSGKHVLWFCKNVLNKCSRHNAERDFAVNTAERQIINLISERRDVGSLCRIHSQCQHVLSVPIQSVTTRLPKEPSAKDAKTNTVTLAENTSGSVMAADAAPASGTSTNKADKKRSEAPKPVEVVFLEEVDHARMVPVKRGIADDSYVEIVEGLKEGQEVVSGGYKAISRELEDSKKIRKGKPEGDKEKEKK